MDGFVSAYSKATGKKQRIPERWLDDEVLSKRFELTPSTRDSARDKAADKAAKKTAATPPPDTTSQTPDADHPAADKTPA